MNNLTIGIDPGRKGGIVVLNENGEPILAISMPMIGDDYDYKIIDNWIENVMELNPCVKVAIERVGFMGVETAKNISDLVHHAGVLYGIAVAHKLPIILAQPSVWKKKIGLPTIGIGYAKKGESEEDKRKRVNENAKKRKTAKDVSIQHAIRLMPKLQEVAIKVTDGIAEAALIAEFARRTLINEI